VAVGGAMSMGGPECGCTFSSGMESQNMREPAQSIRHAVYANVRWRAVASCCVCCGICKCHRIRALNKTWQIFSCTERSGAAWRLSTGTSRSSDGVKSLLGNKVDPVKARWRARKGQGRRPRVTSGLVSFRDPVPQVFEPNRNGWLRKSERAPPRQSRMTAGWSA
jgi:hypothetical protein